MATFAIVLTSLSIGGTSEVKADEGQDPPISVTLGGKQELGNNIIQFTEVTVNAKEGFDKKITSFTIHVNVGYISSYPTQEAVGSTGMMMDINEDKSKADQHQTITYYWTGDGNGLDVGDIGALLKSVQYYHESGMVIDVTVDTNINNLPSSKDKTITMISELSHPLSSLGKDNSVHYYMFVPTTANQYTWQEAYNFAKGYQFMGMRGYLATITERAEDEILDKLSTVGAWAGGIRLSNTEIDKGNLRFDVDPTYQTAVDYYSKPSKPGESSWYWVNGPEAGCYINTMGSYMTNEQGDFIDKTSPASQSYDSESGRSVPHYGGKPGNEATADTREYSNWRRENGRTASGNNREPNNDGSNEWCLQVHYPKSGGSEQELPDPNNVGKYLGWNDLPNAGNSWVKVEGYFVEFSQYMTKNAAGELVPNGTYTSNSTITITLDVDHVHTWEIGYDSSDPENPELNDIIKIACTDAKCTEEYTIKPTAAPAEYTGKAYNGFVPNDTIGGKTIGDHTYESNVRYVSTDGGTYDSADPPTNAGDYKVIVTLYENGSPVLGSDSKPIAVEKTFTISKKAATITAKGQTITKGDDPKSEPLSEVVTTEGLCDGDSLTGIEIEITTGTDGTTRVVKPKDGTAVIKNQNGTGADVIGNYEIECKSGALTETKRTLTVNTSPTTTKDITYGDKLSTITSDDFTGGVVKDGETVVPGHWEWVDDTSQDPDTIYPTVGDSGTKQFKVRFVPEDTDLYEPIENAGTVTITVKPRELTIAWDNFADGTFTYDGDTHKPTATAVAPASFPSSLTIPTVNVTIEPPTDPTLRKGIDATPEGVSYTAKAELAGDAAANYVIADTAEKTKDYHVGKKTLTVKLKNQDINIGSIRQGTDEIESKDGLISGDNITDFTVKADREDPANPKVTGDSITIKNSTGKQVTDNYNVTYTPGTLKENKITLTKEDNVTKLPEVIEITYGDTLEKSTITPGVVEYNGETITGEWRWDAPTTTPDAGDSGEYSIIFEPTGDDANKYKPIQFSIPVKVNKREIGLEWGATLFTYDGENHAPTATVPIATTPAEEGILQNDSENVSVTVSGQKIDANITASGEEQDHYVATATLSGTKAGNYSIKNVDEQKNFKIDPKELGNDKTIVLISKDGEGKPTISEVSIDNKPEFGTLAGKLLTKTDGSTPGDYKIKVEEDDTYYTLTAEFVGNFTGKATRIITKPKKTPIISPTTGDVVGNMEIFVQVDESVKRNNRNPSIERVTEPGKTEEQSVLDSFLDTFNEVTLDNGESLKGKLAAKSDEYITDAEKYIDLYELNEVQKSELSDAEQGIISAKKTELAADIKKEIKDPIYLDLTMRQEYEVLHKKLDGTTEPVTGRDAAGNPVSQVKVSEPIYTNDGETVKIAFDFPSELIKPGMTTKCYVLRVHDRVDETTHARTGSYEPEYVARDKVVTLNNRRIEFTTNKFSTYVVMYTQEPTKRGGGGGSSSSDPEPGTPTQPVQVVPVTPYTVPLAYASPKTGDTKDIYALIAVMAAGLCYAGYEVYRKKRNAK